MNILLFRLHSLFFQTSLASIPGTDGIIDNVLQEVKKHLIDALINDIMEIERLLNGWSEVVADNQTVTPMNWANGDAWDLVKDVADKIMLPVGGLLLGWLFCMELINLINQKNNMHELETFTFFKLIMKLGIQVFVLSRSIELVGGFISVGTGIMAQFGTVTTGNLPATFPQQGIQAMLKTQPFGAILNVWVTVMILKLIALVIHSIAFIAIYGRLLNLVLYSPFAPVALSTMGNQEWNIGKNYIKNILALTFQGFLIIFILKLNTVTISYILSNVPQVFNNASDLIGALTLCCVHGVVYATFLLKTGSITKSIFNAG